MSRTADFHFRWPLTLLIAMLANALCGHANAQAPHRALPALINQAAVESGSVKLSDLLPENASADLRAQAKDIPLGRAPEPGSFRIFTDEELRHAIGGRIAVDIPAEVIVGRRGWPVSADRIRSAADALGVPVDWSQAEVVLPEELVTRTAEASLRASQVRLGENPRTLRVRLECREPHDCAPFWATMIFTKPITLPHTEQATTRPQPRVSAALVRPGRLALLLCDAEGLRFSLRVLPLKCAGLGEAVKAFDPRTRRTFLAEVRGPDLLRLEFSEGK